MNQHLKFHCKKKPKSVDELFTKYANQETKTFEELEKDGFLDLYGNQKEKDVWSHFLVNEKIKTSICKYCQRRFNTVRYLIRD